MRALAGALAVKERRHRAEGGKDAGAHVGHGFAHGSRRAALWTGQAHQPAHRLDHQIERRPVFQRAFLAEARDRGVYDILVQRSHGRLVQAQPRHHAGPEVLHQHVAFGNQGFDQRAPLGCLEVDRHAFLVPVEQDEIGALAVFVGAEKTGLVANPGHFDLDHFCPEIGKHRSAIRSRHHSR